MMHEQARPSMDCAGAKERLFDLLDGELDDTTMDRMRRHIAECRGCFDRSDFERRFLAAVQAVRDAGLCPGALRERVLAALRAEGWQG
jgi:anti-sigma factor (TIGR02949 family)